MVEFELVAPQSARRKGLPIHVMLIMKTHPHCRVRDIRRAYRDGTLTIADAMKSLHIFITTEPAPDDHRKWTKWGLRLIQSFRHRWRIESGFAGLEKTKPASHARSNETKLLQWTFGMFQVQLLANRESII